MRILTTNWHVPYLHMLSKVPNTEWIVVSFRNRGRDWQDYYRKRPQNVKHICIDSDEEVLPFLQYAIATYKVDRILMHDPSDLDIFCDEKLPIYNLTRQIKKLFLFHNASYTQLRGLPPDKAQQTIDGIKTIFQREGIVPVAISEWKARSWQVPCIVIMPAIDPVGFPNIWNGQGKKESYAIQVCSNFAFRDFMNGFNDSRNILQGIPTKVLGEGNENLKQFGIDARKSESFEDYKSTMADARFYLTANIETFEDWHNLSILEAISLGIPVVSAKHSRMIGKEMLPLCSDDLGHLKSMIANLMTDYSWAKRMAKKQEGYLEKYFPYGKFITNWSLTLER